MNNKKLKPFLRWAGGKQWVSSRLCKMMPGHIGTYYEPFLGGGSLYFAALPRKAVLSDVNSRLIEAYQVLRDEPIKLIDALSFWINDEKTYYAVRDYSPENSVFRAAQFIYLNRTCWNGLYRVNRQGKFNVPFGNNSRTIVDSQHLLRTSQALQSTDLKCCDFATVESRISSGDFIYLDPPYTAIHMNNGFRQYNETLFSWQDQQRLGQVAVRMAQKGCQVVVSNACSDSILELYPGFAHRELMRHSILAANPNHRQRTVELLIVSDPNMFQSLDT